MANFKYQESYADELTARWLKGDHPYVRTTIRNLQNKAQAAYIAAWIVADLCAADNHESAEEFIEYMHPNNK